MQGNLEISSLPISFSELKECFKPLTTGSKHSTYSLTMVLLSKHSYLNFANEETDYEG